MTRHRQRHRYSAAVANSEASLGIEMALYHI